MRTNIVMFHSSIDESCILIGGMIWVCFIAGAGRADKRHRAPCEGLRPPHPPVRHLLHPHLPLPAGPPPDAGDAAPHLGRSHPGARGAAHHLLPAGGQAWGGGGCGEDAGRGDTLALCLPDQDKQMKELTIAKVTKHVLRVKQ